MAALGLPDEIIETILLKLPINSLMKFKSFSKLWNSMISDFLFIRTHYELSMNLADSDNLFLHNIRGRWFSLVRFEGQEYRAETRLCWRYGCFVCSGDGLVLIRGDKSSCDPNTYMLWNPRTRQVTILRFPYHNDSDLHYAMHGLCYDPINKDVKVVIASKDFYFVYSCKNSSWAGKVEFPYEIDTEEIGGGLSVDGASYWMCNEEIVCFDSKNDSFKILQKPKNIKDARCFHLKARKGRLYFCGYEDHETTVKIWIKEKGECSWKLLVNIDNLNNLRLNEMGLRVESPLTENEMIIKLGRERYCIYNFCEKSYQEFKINPNTWETMHPFLDGMFLPVTKRESSRKRKLGNA